MLILRYILDIRLQPELNDRMRYVYDVFSLYVIHKKTEHGFIILESVPSTAVDVLLIVGHDKAVRNLLYNNVINVHEKNIVIISCNVYPSKYFISIDKRIFISNHNKGYTERRHGIDYGFSFDISDSELDLYNSSGPVLERIEKAFIKL